MHRVRMRRRFRARTLAQRTDMITAREFLVRGAGIPAPVATRYASAFTRAARKAGIIPDGHTWTRPGRRRFFRTATYSLRQLAGLMAVFAAYLPGGRTKADKTRNRHIWNLMAARVLPAGA
ncbi:hypothetical protein ACH427_32240 [Streptomyces sp. NPDC020379]|uniref:hypothetical protein n=1 Tax=Streptomyces sp. NPDC020379 TaxID=3365071 RepID=UPI0037B86CED